MKIKESISAVRTEDRWNPYGLCSTKLIQIVQFLGRNNLPVKFMFLQLADVIQKPIIKQYLDSWNKNAVYIQNDS